MLWIGVNRCVSKSAPPLSSTTSIVDISCLKGHAQVHSHTIILHDRLDGSLREADRRSEHINIVIECPCHTLLAFAQVLICTREVRLRNVLELGVNPIVLVSKQQQIIRCLLLINKLTWRRR
jgi:hypothetical protein